jgi:hypothetical protein
MKSDNYTFIDLLLITVSFGVSALGLLVLAGATLSIAEGKESNILVSLMLMAIFGIGPIVGGYFMYKNFKLRKKFTHNSAIESKILQLAKSNNGIIFPTELALSTGLTLEESKEELDRMQINGYSTIEVTEEGKIYYKIDLK